ncbi:hypothetical protein F2Q68_00041138 [Brassica cretica]|uniref:Uncharacterized protein n=1 Tax=Brassica cretica TaxID=69181 RepID=A0A8S9MPI4_BRACR|nr:hypothetical protein F2Q68_00041138 [Brassica cretica]
MFGRLRPPPSSPDSLERYPAKIIKDDPLSVYGTLSLSRYINWDGVHLTEGMYKVMADMFLDGSFTRPKFSYLLNKKLNGL